MGLTHAKFWVISRIASLGFELICHSFIPTGFLYRWVGSKIYRRYFWHIYSSFGNRSDSMPKTLALVIYLCRVSIFRPAPQTTENYAPNLCLVCGLRNLYSWISISYQTILLSYPTSVSFGFSLCLQLFCSEPSLFTFQIGFHVSYSEIVIAPKFVEKSE